MAFRFNPTIGCGCCDNLIPGWTLYHNEVSPKLHILSLDTTVCTGYVRGGLEPIYLNIPFYYYSGETELTYITCDAYSPHVSGTIVCEPIDIPLTGVYDNNTWIVPLKIKEVNLYYSNSTNWDDTVSGIFRFDESLDFCGVGSHYCTHTNFSGSLKLVSGYFQLAPQCISTYIGYRNSTNSGDTFAVYHSGYLGSTEITINLSGNINVGSYWQNVGLRMGTDYYGIMSGGYASSGSGCLYEIGSYNCCESENSFFSIGSVVTDNAQVGSRFGSRTLPLDYPFITNIGSSFIIYNSPCSCVCSSGFDVPNSGYPELRFSSYLTKNISYPVGGAVGGATVGFPVEGYMNISCSYSFTVPPSGQLFGNYSGQYPFMNAESGLNAFYMPNSFMESGGQIPIEDTYSCIPDGSDGYRHAPMVVSYWRCPPYGAYTVESGHHQTYNVYGYRRPMISKYPVLAWIQLLNVTLNIDTSITNPYYCENLEATICLNQDEIYEYNYYQGLFLAKPDTINPNRHILDYFDKNDFQLVSNVTPSSYNYPYTFIDEVNCLDPGTVYPEYYTDTTYIIQPASLDAFEFDSASVGGSDLCIP